MTWVMIIPVVITVYADRSFSFITKTPPAAVLIKKECNIESGSGVPNKTKVATISKASVQKIAEMKMRDLNAGSLEAAMSMIAGTCRVPWASWSATDRLRPYNQPSGSSAAPYSGRT